MARVTGIDTNGAALRLLAVNAIGRFLTARAPDRGAGVGWEALARKRRRHPVPAAAAQRRHSRASGPTPSPAILSSTPR